MTKLAFVNKGKDLYDVEFGDLHLGYIRISTYGVRPSRQVWGFIPVGDFWEVVDREKIVTAFLKFLEKEGKR